jgi:hypothetical protein
MDRIQGRFCKNVVRSPTIRANGQQNGNLRYALYYSKILVQDFVRGTRRIAEA